MAEAAKAYASNKTAAVAKMGRALARFEGDCTALADPALGRRVTTGQALSRAARAL